MVDCSSFSRPDLIAIESVTLHFVVDPRAKTFTGEAEYTVVAKAHVDGIVLDTHSVEITASTKPFRFETPRDDEVFGRALHVSLGQLHPGSRATFGLSFNIHTDSKALCWLDVDQTENGTLPFLYTQGQSILNRGLFPCQDTPSHKFTYTAKVKVPEGFATVMSAKLLGSKPSDAGFVEYRFEMPQKVPSYLIALAVGDLQMRKIGPRSVVWAEPCLVDAAQKEFDGITEEYLEAGIALFGPYEWEDYNILVVPSFPYGGMENPRLTFVSPTLVVGDRSLTGVVAHEIAHSWTGNLVTNSNWGEFWLNEGFTMYAEREIVASVQGRALSDLQAYQGMNLLKEEYKNIGEDNPITALRAKIDGIDPDDAYCQCAYEGGYLLLKHIEGLVGGRDVFVPFLRAYVAKFRWLSVTTADFIAFLVESFPGVVNAEEISRYVDQTGSAHVHWLGKGSELRDLALSHANAWWCDGSCGLKALTCVDTMTVMLDEIFDKIKPLVFPQHSAIAQAQAEDPARSEKLLAHAHKLVHTLDASYSLSATPNPEISMRFTKLVVITKSTDLYGAAETYLLKKAKGKQKFLLPVFRLIGRIADDVQMAWAKQVFAKLDGRINQGVTKYIKRILA